MKGIDAQTYYRFAPSLAVVSGLIVLMLAGLLAYNEVRGKVSTLVNSRQVVRLHEDLRNQPRNDGLKTAIRRLDLELRREMFYRLRLSHNAARALLAGLVVFLASAHFMRTYRDRSADPRSWGERRPGAEKR